MFVALLGGLAARVKDANVVSGIMDITFWRAVAMGITAGIDKFFGITV